MSMPCGCDGRHDPTCPYHVDAPEEPSRSIPIAVRFPKVEQLTQAELDDLHDEIGNQPPAVYVTVPLHVVARAAALLVELAEDVEAYANAEYLEQHRALYPTIARRWAQARKPAEAARSVAKTLAEFVED